MSIEEQIDEYLASQPELKRQDMMRFHHLMLEILPEAKLWFLDGKDQKGKIVSNPSIGYGFKRQKYADGKIKEFYQIGVSANSSGISIYILGLEDKNYLRQNFADKIGKASVTGYCIKFKKLDDLNMETLVSAIKSGIEQTQG